MTVFAVAGDRYYRLKVGAPLFYVDEGYPKDLAEWNLPIDSIDAAVSYNSWTYFFSGKQYYRYNDISMEVSYIIVTVFGKFNLIPFKRHQSLNVLGRSE